MTICNFIKTNNEQCKSNASENEFLYCKIHYNLHIKNCELMKQNEILKTNGLRGCSKRGCFNSIKIEDKHKQCDACREKGRQYENEIKNKRMQTNAFNIDENGMKICNNCNKKYEQKNFINKNTGQLTLRCLKCREKQNVLDKKRNKEHVSEIRRFNESKPERKETKRIWNKNNKDKTIEYSLKGRAKAIEKNGIDAYREKNSKQMAMWRKNNKESVIRYKEKCKTNESSVYNYYSVRAIKSGIEMNLSLELFSNLMHQPCFYCGQINEKGCNGVDRINSQMEYSENNCVSCCTDCNMLKGCLSIVSFLKRIIHILSYNKKIQKNYTYFDAFYRNENKQMYKFYLNRAIKKKLECNLTLEEFNNLIIQNCYLCGYKPQVGTNGIDRINNIEGYVLNNVSPCCSECNYMKKNYDLNWFFEHLNKIYTNLDLNSEYMLNILNNRITNEETNIKPINFKNEWLLDNCNKFINKKEKDKLLNNEKWKQILKEKKSKTWIANRNDLEFNKQYISNKIEIK